MDTHFCDPIIQIQIGHFQLQNLTLSLPGVNGTQLSLNLVRFLVAKVMCGKKIIKSLGGTFWGAF